MKLLFENWRKFLITEAENQTLYYIGKRPASPKPKRSGWYRYNYSPGDEEGWDRPQHDEPVESGVFLSPNPVGIAQNHGIFGHVYAYNVSNAIIAAAGGLNRYDFGSEVLIPEDLWNEGMETGEIQFLGKSMEYDEFVKKADRAMSLGDRLARTRRRLDESFSKPEDQAIEKASFNSAQSSQHRWGRGQPIIDYVDTPEGRIYTATYPDGTENSDLWPRRESKPGEDVETFLKRAKEPIQFNLFENWRKYLSEQPRSVPSFAKGAQRQEEVLNYYSRWKEKLQDTGEKFDNYNIFSHDAGDGIVYFLINSEGTPKLYLFLDGKDHTVDPVMKAEDAKDIWTSKFYKYLMKKHGYISSGTDQSPDSQKIWARFDSDDTVSVEPSGKLQKRATLK